MSYMLNDTVVPAMPDGYHLTGTIIAFPSQERPYYSINFTCADGGIENLWLEEREFLPADFGAHQPITARLHAALRAARLALCCAECLAASCATPCAWCAAVRAEGEEGRA
jgi:hypothetical protein